MNKITDKVYLGDCFGAENENAIKAEGITHVLSCMGHLSPKYKDKSIVQKIIELEDDEKQNIFQYFRDSIQFIENSIEENNLFDINISIINNKEQKINNSESNNRVDNITYKEEEENTIRESNDECIDSKNEFLEGEYINKVK